MKNLASVVIVGRINVGKSALFNRLTETTKALVSSISGTTRDYNLSNVSWNKKTFQLVDTGGVNIETLKHSIEALISPKKISGEPADSIEAAIINQTRQALQKSSLTLMVVDGQAGLLPDDRELALMLKKLKTPTLLVCNKIDSPGLRHQVSEFFKLGLGQPNAVSASSGSGTGDLLDAIASRLKGRPGPVPAFKRASTVAVAVIGKPNVGKSSLVNQILGEERVIVSPVPHTTREPQDTEIVYQDQSITLIDTAGLRRQSNTARQLERMAVRKTLDTIKRATVVLLVTEANEPLTVQDSRLAKLVQNAKVGVIIVANKWDILTDKTPKVDTKVIHYYQSFFPSLGFAPLVFTSAMTGRNVGKLLDLVVTVRTNRRRIVPPEQLQTVLRQLVKKHKPTQAKGPKRPHLYELVQTRTDPPIFTVTVGSGQSIHSSYVRFIENQLRQVADFTGVPLTVNTVTKRDV